MKSTASTAGGLRGLLQRFDVDQPVFYGLLARGWGLCAGPVTAVVIAAKFSPELQGFYFTFATILALKTFVELGLGTVIIQFASHEWSGLRLDESGRISGDGGARSRLASIFRFATKWYSIGAVAAAVGLGIAGYAFFSGPGSVGVDWVAPWLVLCAVTAATLWLVPIWSLLEGCNQVGPLYRFRFFQGLISSLALWVAVLAGAGLWTASISGLATLACSAVFLRHRYRGFLQSLAACAREGPAVAWRAELWPMQWRIAVSWIGGYFIFSFFVPVLFRFQGPVVAGQMGMTWSIVGAMGAIADAWLSPRAPMLGILIAQKKYEELDRQFWRIAGMTVGVAALAATGIWLVVFLLNSLEHPFSVRLASRILPPLPTALFLLAQVFYMAAAPFSTYLRAHKREPLMVFSVAYAGLVAISTVVAGKFFSVRGMALGYLVLNAIMMPGVVLIWHRCRARWHA